MSNTKLLTRKQAAVRWALAEKVYAHYNGVNLPIRPLPGSPRPERSRRHRYSFEATDKNQDKVRRNRRDLCPRQGVPSRE